MQQVALMYENTPQAAPARRRIIQQPLRTDPSFALIASDANATTELAARLKRSRALITFASLSHFLAEPPRRERWEGIVVARSGAWDARLDAYVRGRRRLALYGPAEENYGWPEEVARVHGMGELESWLEALAAPDVPLKKERVKRSTRAQPRAVPTAPADRASQSAPPARLDAPKQSGPAAGEPAAATPARPRPKPSEREAARTERKRRTSGPGAGRVAAPPPAPPAPRPLDLVRSILADVRASGATSADARAQREFSQLAAEIGLSRAFEIVAALRERAQRLTLGGALPKARSRSRPAR